MYIYFFNCDSPRHDLDFVEYVLKTDPNQQYYAVYYLKEDRVGNAIVVTSAIKSNVIKAHQLVKDGLGDFTRSAIDAHILAGYFYFKVRHIVSKSIEILVEPWPIAALFPKDYRNVISIDEKYINFDHVSLGLKLAN